MSCVCFDFQVCFVIYFLSILSYHSTDPTPETPERTTSPGKLRNNNFGVDNEPLKNQMNQPKEKMTFSDEEMKKKESLWKMTPEFSSKAPPSVEMWRGLYQRHWPELLNYYNISLLGRLV